ncbi:ankyrin repeat domain-containing protein 10b [Chanos chanos]|uniref:Ankyrin repeat domain-containing protein 10b n=1 Tax=Chanos chanos TaxID=29144 RepID=A0A6J2W9Y4_CHACN|nr:ankyrin repeat domain-containing protein 10-like [Chanos chanos]
MSVGIESGFSSEEVLSIRFPLHRACRDGDIGALCSLLQCATNKADLAVEDSFYGWTPLHWAAHFGKLECMMRLVQVGCSVNSVTSRFAQTPTHIAAFGGHPQCLLWLLQSGADINRQDYVGETPVHKAARAGSMECVNALLMHGAKADLRNASGLTAADLAHTQGFQECAQLLSNAQNQQLNQLNSFPINGSLSNGDHHQTQGRSLLNGAPNRKRSLDCMEPSHIKKARTDGAEMPLKMSSGMNGFGGEDQMEGVHMEFGPALSTTGTLSSGHCHPSQSLNETGITPACESGNSEIRNGCHFGDMGVSSCSGNANPDNGHHCEHHHGDGETAEMTEDISSQMEHHTTVRAEQHYDSTFFNTVHLYHGS